MNRRKSGHAHEITILQLYGQTEFVQCVHIQSQPNNNGRDLKKKCFKTKLLNKDQVAEMLLLWPCGNYNIFSIFLILCGIGVRSFNPITSALMVASANINICLLHHHPSHPSI